MVKSKLILSLLGFGPLLLLPISYASDDADVAKILPVLEGQWVLQNRSHEQTLLIEEWARTNGAAYAGRGYALQLETGEVTDTEALSIEKEGNDWIYTARPRNQSATGFRLKKAAEGYLRFENPAHDFPKFIEYRWTSPDTLIARIGDPGDPTVDREFSMVRRNTTDRSPRAEPGSLPGVVGMDHVGISVPDSEAAIRFFTEVLGCRVGLSFGPMSDPTSDSMQRRLNVHPRTVIRQITLLQCAAGVSIELLEYDSPDQSMARPRNSDVGGHHIAFRVQDIEKSAAWLREHGYVTFDGPVTMQGGPAAGLSILYFESPWGLQLELVAQD